MLAITHLKGDASFEYHGNDLLITFQGGNDFNDDLISVTFGEFAIRGFHDALVEALSMLLMNAVPKEQLLRGSLRQGESA